MAERYSSVALRHENGFVQHAGVNAIEGCVFLRDPAGIDNARTVRRAVPSAQK